MFVNKIILVHFIVSFLFSVNPVAGKCKDLLSRKNTAFIQSNKRIELVWSCQRIVMAYPGQCALMGREDGMCCRSCKKVGVPTCLDSISPTISSYILQDVAHGPSVKVTIKSCKEVAKYFLKLCSGWGRPKGRCCNSCKDFVPCLLLKTWKAKHQRCKNCTCLDIAKKNLARELCMNNIKGRVEGKKMSIKEACCQMCSLSNFGFPPHIMKTRVMNT